MNKWIGLHVVGERQEQIKKIAHEESGYHLNEPVMTDMRSEYY